MISGDTGAPKRILSVSLGGRNDPHNAVRAGSLVARPKASRVGPARRGERRSDLRLGASGLRILFVSPGIMGRHEGTGRPRRGSTSSFGSAAFGRCPWFRHLPSGFPWWHAQVYLGITLGVLPFHQDHRSPLGPALGMARSLAVGSFFLFVAITQLA